MGRPSNPFAPKSSRISRFLLIHPSQRFRQKKIAERTGVGRGWTSKVVRRLEEKGLVARREDGRIEVPDPPLLLSAWHEKYDFSKHRALLAKLRVSAGPLIATPRGEYQGGFPDAKRGEVQVPSEGRQSGEEHRGDAPNRGHRERESGSPPTTKSAYSSPAASRIRSSWPRVKRTLRM